MLIVREFLRDFFNGFHGGSGLSFLDTLERTPLIDAAWKAYANINHIPLSRAGKGDDSTAAACRRFLDARHHGLFGVDKASYELFEKASSVPNSIFFAVSLAIHLGAVSLDRKLSIHIYLYKGTPLYRIWRGSDGARRPSHLGCQGPDIRISVRMLRAERS